MATGDSQKQIKHMMAFIEQEANEKIEEIDAKAEEEFNIEKGRILQQNRQKIIEQYEKKEKQVELQERIQHANLYNQERLNLLKKREDAITEVLEEARCRLGDITENKAEYKVILEKLILQGILHLMEPEVLLRYREADQKLITDCLDKVRAKAEQRLGFAINIEEDVTYLPPETKGGVILFAQAGHIMVPNTLESRLEMISQQLMPEIRAALFGKNERRKFSD